MRNRLLLRVIFLALLVGGLVLWGEQRKPRDLSVQVDLTGALPGEIVELDVVVRREGHLLARHDVQYGSKGAPGVVEMPVHATAGAAEVETTLVYAGKPAHKGTAAVTLSAKEPAVVRAQ